LRRVATVLRLRLRRVLLGRVPLLRLRGVLLGRISALLLRVPLLRVTALLLAGHARGRALLHRAGGWRVW
jgi:hypothetical protein